jgi:Icc protein
MPKNQLNRRQFLNIAGLAAVGTTYACAPKAKKPNPSQTNSQALTTLSSSQKIGQPLNEKCQPAKNRVLRIALMTDFHLMQEFNAIERSTQALRHAQTQADPPQVIFNTGDSIMESLKSSKERAEDQWQAYNELIKLECRLPIYHAIGNHDVWGWGNADVNTQSDPLYGKGMALKMLGLENPFYSFDLAGWRFIFLDSTHLPNEVSKEPYIGKLDDDQFAWMTEEIEKTSPETNICILSHIPILCACELLDGQNEASGNWVMPAAWMHIDARRFRQILLKHKNIRVCLSGHAHQYESLDYLGVRYITGGAVCGNWWMGAYMDFPPAYVMVDLYEDGSAESEFVAY